MPVPLEALESQGGKIVLRLRFGGGLNSATNEAEIDIRECASGENFDLAIAGDSFRPRKPFRLVGTAPNDGRINGFVELTKTDGSVTNLVQAGGEVYDFDAISTFTSVGSISSNARIRGSRFST